GLYEAPPPPTRPIITADPAALDQVRGAILEADATIAFPALAITFPAGMGLDRSQRLALSIMHDSLEERPIYFASAGGMMADLGLEPWSVRQGLVAKLVLRRLEDP